MYGNNPGHISTNTQFVMDDEQIEEFRKGINRVRKETARQLTSQFNVVSSVEMTTAGQQGLITIAVPGMMQVQFNVTPQKEMFEEDIVIPSEDAEELGANISATILSSLFEQVDTSGFPAQ